MITTTTTAATTTTTTTTVKFLVLMTREFEKNASELVEELYELDQDKSHLLLDRQLATWKRSSVLKLADSANLMDFMEQDCCQTKLDTIWRGKLSTSTAWWQVRTTQFTHSRSVAYSRSQAER